MMGKECLGVDLKDRKAVSNFISCCLEGAEHLAGTQDLIEIISAMRSMKQDQMGLGMIFYFPDIPFLEQALCSNCMNNKALEDGRCEICFAVDGSENQA
jgi:hypothetical protein